MLRDDVYKYTELTGEDGWHVPIMKLGAYLDGYDKGLEVLDKIRADIENSEIVYDKSPNYKDKRTDEEKVNDLWKMCKVLVLSTIDKYRAESEVKE